MILLVYILFVLVLRYIGYRNNRIRKAKEQETEKAHQEELLKAAKKAEAANVAKTEFLQRMSHDIRTPINGIIGMVEVGDHYSDNIEKQADCREKIKGASNTLLELVNEVLDMSKLESGEIVLEEVGFNINKLSDETIVMLEELAKERNIQIVEEEKRITHPYLIGSPTHVKRVLMNVLSNAIKYNRDNGFIYVSYKELNSNHSDHTLIEFTCRDTGIGMSKEFQNKIFEPFAQEHIGSRSKYVGTGLGMPIAKSLVEKMGGTLEFTSQEGVGSQFVIRIPFKIDEEHKNGTVKESTSVSIEGLSVLLVEDNELNMEIAEFIIENEGAIVTCATNGIEAVDIYKKSPGFFDIILMDIMMPEMDGLQATQCIRSFDHDIPIVAMPMPMPAPRQQITAMPAPMANRVPVIIKSPFSYLDVVVDAGDIPRSALGYLGGLLDVHTGQADENVGLKQTVEEVEVQTCHGGDHCLGDVIEDLHDDEGAQPVAEQSHAEAGRADGDLEDVHRGHDRRGGSQTLEEAHAAACPDAGTLDQDDAHQRQRCGHIQILCGGLDAEHADQVAEGDVDGYGHQVRHIAPALFAQQTFKEIGACEVGHFQHSLTLADVVHLQVSGKQDRADGDDGQDHPADDHGFRDLQRADLDIFDGQLFHQCFGQIIQLFFLLPEE